MPARPPKSGTSRRVPRKPERNWHLVCETRKGKVSILKDLDLRTARETYKRLRPDEHPETYIWPDCETCRKNGFSYGYWMGSGRDDSDKLKTVHAIGPEGKELDPWHGVEPRVVDRTWMCKCEIPVRKVPEVPTYTGSSELIIPAPGGTGSKSSDWTGMDDEPEMPRNGNASEWADYADELVKRDDEREAKAAFDAFVASANAMCARVAADWNETRTDFWNDPKLWHGINPSKTLCWMKESLVLAAGLEPAT